MFVNVPLEEVGRLGAGSQRLGPIFLLLLFEQRSQRCPQRQTLAARC
jgi:hypothetical protein